MKKKNRWTPCILLLFIFLLSLTIYTSFSSNIKVEEIIIKSMTPVYDETSGVVVNQDNVTFNDKNQVVKYNIVLENTQDYDVKISDITLSTPTEEFLDYKIEGIAKDEELSANSTKEVTISFETMKIDGWGRNFSDELTANITFDKVAKEEVPTIPEDDIKKDEEVADKKTEEENNTSEEGNSNEEESSVEDKEDEITKSEETDNNNGTIENPYTSDNKLLIVLISATIITGAAIIIVSKNKVTKYMILMLIAGSSLSLVKAEKVIELPIKFNINFKSQNVMKMAYTLDENKINNYHDYWEHNKKIKRIYIQNEITEIKEYEHKFDVTEKQNSRVMAYLVTNEENTNYYDLYLQADGIIYPNTNASNYFGDMRKLDEINNLEGLDTSEVTNMERMFFETGADSINFALDVSNFNTSNVTNMSEMFFATGIQTTDFNLDVSNFDTSNVTDMNFMFFSTGFNSKNFALDLSNFDTSNVTNMRGMFYQTGMNSTELTIDLSNFDTSNVKDMSAMFNETGFYSKNFALDVSNFDTSNVTDMSAMFNGTGYNASSFNLDVSSFDTSNVKDMSFMFTSTGYSSTKLNTSITISNPNITSYEGVFEEVATQPGTKLKVNYTSETEELVDNMLATKTEGSNVEKGNLIVDVDKLAIGDEIHISGEKFNVISKTDDTITMLAKYNLGSNYLQTKDLYFYNFGYGNEPGGLSSSLGPDVEIVSLNNNVANSLKSYLSFLTDEVGDDNISVNLITLAELKEIGCEIKDDYSQTTTDACIKSEYADWLTNGQWWWTRSLYPAEHGGYLFIYGANGYFGEASYTNDSSGVRPIVTISKETLKKLN